MKEKDGHRMLNKSFASLQGLSEKIPDMPRFENSRFVPKKPFDGFSVWNKTAYFWEMKMLKPVQGFNCTLKLNDKQKESLEKIHQQSIGCDYIIPLVVLFLYELRSIKQFLFFEWSYIRDINFIPKREIVGLSNSPMAFDIKKERCDLSKLNDKIITYGDKIITLAQNV